MNSPEISPPQHLSERVLQQVHRDLKVNTPWLMLKLLFLHSLVGAVTLIFCPQFTIGPVGEGITTTLYALGRIHPMLCAAFCGTVFLGSTALILALALRSSELVVVKRRSWWIYSLLAAVSLVFFMLAGSVGGSHGFTFVVTWFFAAIVSAWIIFQLGAWVRTKFLPRVAFSW